MLLICYKEAKILLDSLTFRFRRQHEQLRAVIVRVLQPPAVSQATPSSPGGPPKNVEDEEAKPEALLDPADANAIQEVNLAYENVKEVDGLDVSKEGSEAWEAAIKRLVNFVFKMNWYSACTVYLVIFLEEYWLKAVSVLRSREKMTQIFSVLDGF